MLLNVWLCLVDLLDDLSDAGVELIVCLHFLSRIDKKNVSPSSCVQHVFLLSPALSDPSLQKISFYGPFEHLLGNRNHYSVSFLSRIGHIQIP